MKWIRSLVCDVWGQGKPFPSPPRTGLGRFRKGGFSLDLCFPELGEREGVFFNQHENHL